MKRMVIIDSDARTRGSLRAIFAFTFNISLASDLQEGRLLLEEPAHILIIGLIPPANEEKAFLDTLPANLPVLTLGTTSCPLKGVEFMPKSFNVEEIRSKVADLCKAQHNEDGQTDELSDTEKTINLEEAVNEFERELIERALERNNGVQTHAAKQLGTTRRILRYRMDKLGIEVPKRKQSK